MLTSEVGGELHVSKAALAKKKKLNRPTEALLINHAGLKFQHTFFVILHNSAVRTRLDFLTLLMTLPEKADSPNTKIYS